MARESTFIDTLIDRLVLDVRRDVEAEMRANPMATVHGADSGEEPVKAAPPSYDDLVAKMIGLRSRLRSPAPLSPIAGYRPPTKFQVEDVMAVVTQNTRKLVQPKFSSPRMQVAFSVAIKSGARFYHEDLSENGLTESSVKRERRRVLLTLHPDRVPESDRSQAHDAFLEAAEAFSVLMEGIDEIIRAPRAS